jgi:hypothetical protein
MQNDSYSKRQPLTMIPVLNEIVHDMLKLSERQLSRLEEDKSFTHAFDKTKRIRLIEFHTDQNALLPTYVKQCELWGHYVLNQRQQYWVGEIELHVTLLKAVNDKIILFTHQYTTDSDKIMEK